jgi:BirA family biotin operon repressor/biotin-[acetyl-CoA-carboxylase] ligase
MKPDETWSLDTYHLGQTVRVFDQLDSTNTFALALSTDANAHGSVILARSQSAGRGQYGRTWQAPPGSSVLMSVLLFAPPALRQPALLTAWAAVGVCETIQQLTSVQATIKWPNDVLIQGKKVCGILIEQRTTGHADFPLATVAGLGLNVTQTSSMFKQAELPDATSLLLATERTLTSEEVARALIRQLDASYHLLANGNCSTLETAWKARLGLIGREVLVEGMQQTWRGRLLDVTFAGVEFEVEPRQVMRVPPEAIRHVRAVDV